MTSLIFQNVSHWYDTVIFFRYAVFRTFEYTSLANVFPQSENTTGFIQTSR